VLALGLGLRLYHYLRDPSMWHDEAALVLNVLDKGYRDLLGSLSFAEAAPPLFLWIEKTAALLLGDSTYALRLFPLVAGCAALLLFVRVAQRVLRPAAVPWGLLLFACSDHLLWHSCEAKPYAVDVFAATLLLAVYVWTASWSLEYRLLVYGVVAPPLIFIAYPGCFLCGGLLVALFPAVCRTRQAKSWLAYGLLVLSVFASFWVLFAGPIRAQRCEAIVACWKGTFPCWERPWTVPLWTLLALLEVFRYCFEPIGQVFLFLAAAGARRFWQRRRGTLLVLFLIPLLLPLFAAYLQAYPFGGYRVLVYMTPALALLIAEALPLETGIQCGARCAERRAPSAEKVPALRFALAAPRWTFRVLCRYVVLAATFLPLPWAGLRVWHPWSRADCAGAAQYVRSHRLPGDRVAANHWEYRYYFRELDGGFGSLGEVSLPSQGRLWLVTTASAPSDRWAIVHHYGREGWQMLEQHEFTRTDVFLLSRAISSFHPLPQNAQEFPAQDEADPEPRSPLNPPKWLFRCFMKGPFRISWVP
jgi:hypothetical protein